MTLARRLLRRQDVAHHRGQQVVMPDKARPTTSVPQGPFIYCYTCSQTDPCIPKERPEEEPKWLLGQSASVPRNPKNGRYGRSVEIGLHDVALRAQGVDGTDEPNCMYAGCREPLFDHQESTRSNSSCGALPTSGPNGLYS